MNKIFTILFALLLLPTMVNAQNIVASKDMYMFGVAFTPLDSTVYMSELQPITGAHVYKKSKLLYDRGAYSQQMKRFLTDTAGLDRMIVSVSYARKRGAAEKKYIKMKQRFQKKGYLVKFITATDFTFKEIPFEINENQDAEPAVKSVSKKKKKSSR